MKTVQDSASHYRMRHWADGCRRQSSCSGHNHMSVESPKAMTCRKTNLQKKNQSRVYACSRRVNKEVASHPLLSAAFICTKQITGAVGDLGQTCQGNHRNIHPQPLPPTTEDNLNSVLALTLGKWLTANMMPLFLRSQNPYEAL